MTHTTKVFISYSHDNSQHQEFVLDFANKLRTEHGIDCQLDQYFSPGFPPQGWIKWMHDQVQIADFVLMICTPLYRQRFERNVEEDGQGVGFEGVVISQILYSKYFNNNKFIAITPQNGKLEDVPIPLQGYTIYHLPIDFRKICDLINGIRYNPAPPLNKLTNDDPNRTNSPIKKYINWLDENFLEGIDAYTAMDGKKHSIQTQSQIHRKRFIVEDNFSALQRLKNSRKTSDEKIFDNILDALNETEQGVFLGKPGAGKTTTLIKIANDIITSNSHKNNNTQIVPIFLRLGFWTNPLQSFEEFIHEQTNIGEEKLGDISSKLFKENKAILLLDGLNEVPSDQQKKKLEQIRQFLRTYEKVRTYASCREDDYTGEIHLPLAELYILPLNITRIRSFIESYLYEDILNTTSDKLFWIIAGGKDAYDTWIECKNMGVLFKDFWDDIIPQQIMKNQNLIEKWKKNIKNNSKNMIPLAKNPYLLTMILYVFSSGETAFENRGELLKGFTRQLFMREKNKNKQFSCLLQDEGETFEVLIGSVAYIMLAKQAVSIHYEDAIHAMDDNPLWLNLGLQCNIFEKIGKTVRFSHQLIQDYFIALGLKSLFDEGKLPDAQELFWRQDNLWWLPSVLDETIILLAGLFKKDCTPIIQWLKDYNPRLTSRCINESGAKCPDSTKKELSHLWGEKLKNFQQHYFARLEIGLALAKVRLENGNSIDTREGTICDKQGIPHIKWVKIKKGYFRYGEKQYSRNKFVSDFSISCYPISNAQYRSFIASKQFNDDLWWHNLKKPKHISISEQDNYPCIVNWYEAVAFSRWLSNKLGYKVRLPNDWEWEKAAKTMIYDNNPSNEQPDIENGFIHLESFEYGIEGDTYHPRGMVVGINPHEEHPYEVTDMLGNIWEWCQNKPSSRSIVYPDGKPKNARVIRSGGHFDEQGKVAFLIDQDWEWGYPDTTEEAEIAFRLVKDVD